MNPEFVITALSVHLPNVLRWAGGVARLLRQHNVALDGKGTGSAGTDALTLADLSLQELIVSALRDTDPIFRHCRIDAEETTGELAAFPDDAELTIGLDPIDGTRKYRDRAGDGYSVMLHLRSKEAVLYSLVFIPEFGPHGWWVEASGDRIISGPDDPSRPADDVLRSLAPIDAASRPDSRSIYVIGFQHRDAEAARRVTAAGLHGVSPDDLSGCPYELIARGELDGALIHSPNVYDFPVTSHLCRILGGDAVWTRTGEPITFRETWLDDKASMLRLSGIVACSTNRDTLQTLVDLTKNWSPNRYHDGNGL
jgi:3'(2'), 5'-bisphosphate nucleotidase